MTKRRWPKPWNGPLSLKERLNIPKEFEPYVNDYKINLFQIAYLTHEQVELFQSDFKVVADYFVQKRENGDYFPSSQDDDEYRGIPCEIAPFVMVNH